MYNQVQAEKKERRKIIAVATIAVAIILILIAAIVVVATRKTARNGASNGNTAVQVDSNEKKDENKSEESNPKESESDNPMMGELSTTTETKEETKPTNSVAAESSDSPIPTTGPEDYLPIALMAGMLVTYLTSRKLAKEEA